MNPHPDPSDTQPRIPPEMDATANLKKSDVGFIHSLSRELHTHNQSFLAIIRNRIIAGFFVIIPLILSVWIAWFLYSKLTEWAVWITDQLYNNVPALRGLSEFWLQQLARAAALLIMLTALFLIGQIAKFTMGRKLILLLQGILLKVPIINFIYSTSKQLGDALWSSKGGNMFRQVVLFEYPMKGCYAIGFMTNENKSGFEVTEKLNTPLVSVFMPTTPNPTSGFLMFIPRSNCIFLDMSVSDAMRLIVSCGAVLPDSAAQELMNRNRESAAAAH